MSNYGIICTENMGFSPSPRNSEQGLLGSSVVKHLTRDLSTDLDIRAMSSNPAIDSMGRESVCTQKKDIESASACVLRTEAGERITNT